MEIWQGILLCLMLAPSADADCDADVDEYIKGLDPTNPSDLQLWSLEMFDSSSKFVTEGTMELAFLYQLGNFDQCVAVNGPQGTDGEPKFSGQYCFFDIGLQLPSNEDNTRTIQLQQNVQRITNIDTAKAEPLTLPRTFWGVCAPSSCGLDGVKRVADFNMQFFASSLGYIANTTVRTDSCYYENDGSLVLDAAAWCFVAFSALLLCLVCASTLVEILFPTFEFSGWKSIFKAFSLNQTLVKDLLYLPNKRGYLACLHGMRTLSMIWIVLCHTYSITPSFPLQNFRSFSSEFMRQWFMAPILNGYLAVDSFFLLSGLLIVYVPMMDSKKGIKFNVFKYYLYRYLRITIPLAMAIWFVSSANIYTGKGPLWFYNNRSAMKYCQENWWPNLLYISNYFFSYCMLHTWYLCVDMQLALLAPLIIYPLLRWPKYGLAAICILTLGSTAAVFAITYTENLPWTSQFNVEGKVMERYGRIIYGNTPMRASPYLIGMALGYALSKKFHVPLPKWGVALGWFVSAALGLSVVFLILVPYSEGYVRDALVSAFYSSLHRPAWSISLGWVIWACANGYGGFVDKILSWKYFVPASKLTFSGYLTHLIALSFYSNLRRTPFYVSHIENWYVFGSILFLTMPYTLFLYLVVEAPSMNLMRLAFKKRQIGQEPRNVSKITEKSAKG